MLVRKQEAVAIGAKVNARGKSAAATDKISRRRCALGQVSAHSEMKPKATWIWNRGTFCLKA